VTTTVHVPAGARLPLTAHVPPVPAEKPVPATVRLRRPRAVLPVLESVTVACDEEPTVAVRLLMVPAERS
jgi:hypothetical protein